MMSVIHHHIYFLNLDHIRKALSERLAILLQSNPPQTAHTILNEEVKEKLPGNVNKGMVRKRTDTARKIYDIFNEIGEDKIRRIAV